MEFDQARIRGPVGFQTKAIESLGIVSTPTWRRHPIAPDSTAPPSPIRGPAATPSPPTPPRRCPRRHPIALDPAAPPSSTCRGFLAAPPSSTCRGVPAAPPSSTCRGVPAAPPSSTWPEHPHSRRCLHPLRCPLPPCEGCLHPPCQGCGPSR
jgi:hypothetical protein